MHAGESVRSTVEVKDKDFFNHRPCRPKGDVDASVHIFETMALEEVDWLSLGSKVFTTDEPQVLIFIAG